MNIKRSCLALLLLTQTLSFIGFAQKTESPEAVARVAFTLRNNLGYHRMFRAEGPGMAYGFTMSRNESTPKNWPVGSKLYFSKDGETTEGFIFTVTGDDAGKTLLTKPETTTRSSIPLVTVRFRNNSMMPRKISIITYRPDEAGNGTKIMMLMPMGNTKQELPVGTKVYFADEKQVDSVMSGQRIDGSKPFLVVKKEDKGKTINIFR